MRTGRITEGVLAGHTKKVPKHDFRHFLSSQ